jgi:hypothetical protein
VERQVLRVRTSISRTRRGAATSRAWGLAQRLGQGHSNLSPRRQRHGHAGRFGQGNECHRAPRAGADRRLGRSRSIDLHRAARPWGLRATRRKRPRSTGIRGGRLELRRPKPALRRTRTRHGRDPERSGSAWWDRTVRRDVPDLFRLHAAAHAPRRIDGTARDLRVHARQYRPWRGRLDASAGRAACRPAFGSSPQCHSPRRCQ